MGGYYLQDKRQIVGNDLVFWAIDSKGYTTDISKAHVFTKESAFSQNAMRETDIPWPKEYIDSKTRPVVDHQHVSREDALGDDVKRLYVPSPPPKDPPFNCGGCGRFLSELDRYHACDNCGVYNNP